MNKKIFTFNTLNIVWPQIKDVINIEQAKSLFRLANTQFKKALNFYNIKEYPFEHIQICQNISQLYKYLISFEFDNNCVIIDEFFSLLKKKVEFKITQRIQLKDI